MEIWWYHHTIPPQNHAHTLTQINYNPIRSLIRRSQMRILPFATEHFFAQYEFNTRYQLCNSDCESMTIQDLLGLANVDAKEFENMTLGYTESQGDPDLRKAIASSYETVKPDDVIVLGSPVEGIYLAARALLEPNEEVIVLNPAYDALYNMFAHIVGSQHVRKWELQAGESEWELDLGILQALITERTKLIVVNFPHNPTGYLPTLDELNQLVALASEHGIWIFYDEMYYGLVHSGTPDIPSAADLYDKAVVLSGLSKTYGLPGLRTGWLVVKDASLRAIIMNWKFYTSICPPAPSEYLAKIALSVKESIRQRNIGIIEKNLQIADAFFSRWPNLFKWRRPRAGSVALVEMDVPSASEFSKKMAEEAGILIQSAQMLGGTDQQIRMGFGRTAFSDALSHFEAYLKRTFVD